MPTAPTIDEAVIFSGTARVGEMIDLTSAEFLGDPTPTVEDIIEFSPTGSGGWEEMEPNTPGGLIIGSELLGQYIRAKSTGTNGSGSVTSTSTTLGPIVASQLTTSRVLPVSNGTLTEISGGTAIGIDYDSEFTRNDSARIRWQGSADAYVRTKQVSQYGGGLVDRYNETTVLIPRVADVEPDCVLKVASQSDPTAITSYKITDIQIQQHDPGLPEAIKCFVVRV
jgi:hypothetical protein